MSYVVVEVTAEKEVDAFFGTFDECVEWTKQYGIGDSELQPCIMKLLPSGERTTEY